MAVNNNGNLLDSVGNVAVDFVWGNIPMQPNDARDESVQGDLSATGDNHVIAYAKWNGYPLFTANSVGAGVGYVVVPSVIGVVTATAVDVLDDAGLTVTTAAAAANTTRTITDLLRTSGQTSLRITTSAAHGYAVGQKITYTDTFGEGTPNDSGTYTIVTVPTSTRFTITTTTSTGISATDSDLGSVIAVSGTIKTQSVAAGGATIAIGQAVTITPWATAS
jgi:hypothetical protein